MAARPPRFARRAYPPRHSYPERHSHHARRKPPRQGRRMAHRPRGHLRRVGVVLTPTASHLRAARCAWTNAARECHIRCDWDSSARRGRLGRHTHRAGCGRMRCFVRCGVGARHPDQRARNAPGASPHSGLRANRLVRQDLAASGVARLRLSQCTGNKANRESANGLHDHPHVRLAAQMDDHDHQIGWMSALGALADSIHHRRRSDPRANCVGRRLWDRCALSVCQRNEWMNDRTARSVRRSHRSAGYVTNDPAGRASRHHPSRYFPCPSALTPRDVPSLRSLRLKVQGSRRSQKSGSLAHTDTAPSECTTDHHTAHSVTCSPRLQGRGFSGYA